MEPASIGWDGELYAAAFPFPGLHDWDCRVYGALARAVGGPVLELGAGTARILGSLLAAGVDAYGLESRATMIRHGQARLRSLGLGSLQSRLSHEDMRRFSHPRAYRLVILPDNSLAGLDDDDDVLEMLAAVSRHLEPGGEFVVDQPRLDQGPSLQTWPARQITVRGEAHDLHTSTDYDSDAAMLSLRLRVCGPARRSEMVLRLKHRSPAHIERLLMRAGFSPSAPAIDERGQLVDSGSALYIGRFGRAA